MRLTEIRAKNRNFNPGEKLQIWVSNSSDTEIRNPRNSLGARLLGTPGFNDSVLRPKIVLSLNLKCYVVKQNIVRGTPFTLNFCLWFRFCAEIRI